jgi:hypothetical protein
LTSLPEHVLPSDRRNFVSAFVVTFTPFTIRVGYADGLGVLGFAWRSRRTPQATRRRR